MADGSSTVVYTPDNNGGSVPAWLAMNNGGWGNGGLFGGNGGGAFLGALLGSIFPNIFGGWGNWGGGYNGGGAAAASLGAQATANNNTELLMNAINGTDSDIRLLATTLNGDVDSIRLAINSVQGAIQTVGAQLGLTGQQVINAIQAGNSDIASRICDCCCKTQQAIMTQGYENQIATLNQTNTLASQADRNTRSITDAIAAQTVAMNDGFCQIKERELQSKIDSLLASNTLLRSQIDNANQTAQFAAMLAPINAKLTEIESKQPNTIPVQYPNVVAVNNTPYAGGMYPGYGYGYGFGNGITF